MFIKNQIDLNVGSCKLASLSSEESDSDKSVDLDEEELIPKKLEINLIYELSASIKNKVTEQKIVHDAFDMVENLPVYGKKKTIYELDKVHQAKAEEVAKSVELYTSRRSVVIQ